MLLAPNVVLQRGDQRSMNLFSLVVLQLKVAIMSCPYFVFVGGQHVAEEVMANQHLLHHNLLHKHV